MNLLITDIGNVLVKTDHAIISAIEKVFEKNSIPLGSRQEMLDNFGISIQDYILGYLPPEFKHKARDLYQDFQRVYPDEVIGEMQVFEGVDEKLFDLKKKLKVCALSCMTKKEVHKVLSLLKFKDFDLVFSLEDYVEKRPSPKGLLMICDELGINPKDACYVGDTIMDISMAKNAGMRSACVLTGLQDDEKLKNENPDIIIDSFKDLEI